MVRGPSELSRKITGMGGSKATVAHNGQSQPSLQKPVAASRSQAPIPTGSGQQLTDVLDLGPTEWTSIRRFEAVSLGHRLCVEFVHGDVAPTGRTVQLRHVRRMHARLLKSPEISPRKWRSNVGAPRGFSQSRPSPTSTPSSRRPRRYRSQSTRLPVVEDQPSSSNTKVPSSWMTSPSTSIRESSAMSTIMST